MTDYTTFTAEQLSELERAAYNSGDTEKAAMLQALAELVDRVELLEEQLDNAKSESLETWEKEHGPASDYYDFFHECFERIEYPAPSVTSDYDKSVIFDAIERGEEHAQS